MCWDVLIFLKADGVTLDERWWMCKQGWWHKVVSDQGLVGCGGEAEMTPPLPSESCLDDKIRRGHWDGKLREASLGGGEEGKWALRVHCYTQDFWALSKWGSNRDVDPLLWTWGEWWTGERALSHQMVIIITGNVRFPGKCTEWTGEWSQNRAL